MAIDQCRFPKPGRQLAQSTGKEPMVGAVDFVDPPIELCPIDPSAPEASVTMSARRDETQTIARTGADRSRGNSVYGSRIKLFLAAIAVDHGTGDVLDDGSEARTDRPPAKPVHQRIFEGFQRSLALRGIGEDGGVINPPCMRH